MVAGPVMVWKCPESNRGPRDSTEHVYKLSWLFTFAAGSPSQRGMPATSRWTLGRAVSASTRSHAIFYDAHRTTRIATAGADGWPSWVSYLR